MFNKILVATDGSKYANRAIVMAAGLAKAYNSEILLIYVVTNHQLPEGFQRMAEIEHLIDPSLGPDTQSPGNVAASMAKSLGVTNGENTPRLAHLLAERVIENEKRNLGKQNIENVKTFILNGDPVSCISELAKQENVDAVVLGSRGLGQIKGLLLGSVSHKIIQLLDCTCIISR